MSERERPLTATFRPMRAIAPHEILQMHELFKRYYENADPGTFLRDLSKKEGAVLVHDRKTGTLRGFSTVVKTSLWDGEREAIGIFSGDTILDPAYWGDRALKDGFARYLLKVKLSNPTTPVYWLLISKGYKTYLLLANNFMSYYPRHDRPNDPKLRRLVEAYCHKLFPKKYDAASEVLDFGEGSQRLRDEVAPISTEMLLQNPAVRYFQQRNPEWQRGVELPCIGEVSLSIFLRYAEKQSRKLRASSRPEAMPMPVRRDSGFFPRTVTDAPSEQPLQRAGNE
jgi:hypothetical protein